MDGLRSSRLSYLNIDGLRPQCFSDALTYVLTISIWIGYRFPYFQLDGLGPSHSANVHVDSLRPSRLVNIHIEGLRPSRLLMSLYTNLAHNVLPLG